MAAWLRRIIQPNPGHALVYLDWEQQEFGIAAVLSDDHRMLRAYESGDPYLAFAKQAGAISMDATKASAGRIRDHFKACALAVQYRMGPHSLATRIGRPTQDAVRLIEAHRRNFPQFWRWTERIVDHAFLSGSITSVLGWPLFLGDSATDRTVANYPMQANGAEMLRVACILCQSAGVSIVAPVHDALLIETPLHDLKRQSDLAQECMRKASRVVLDGYELRTETKAFVSPERFSDARGDRIWDVMSRLVGSE